MDIDGENAPKSCLGDDVGGVARGLAWAEGLLWEVGEGEEGTDMGNGLEVRWITILGKGGVGRVGGNVVGAARITKM